MEFLYPTGEHVAFVEPGSFPPMTDVTARWIYFGVASMRVPCRVRLGECKREQMAAYLAARRSVPGLVKRE